MKYSQKVLLKYCSSSDEGHIFKEYRGYNYTPGTENTVARVMLSSVRKDGGRGVSILKCDRCGIYVSIALWKIPIMGYYGKLYISDSTKVRLTHASLFDAWNKDPEALIRSLEVWMKF